MVKKNQIWIGLENKSINNIMTSIEMDKNPIWFLVREWMFAHELHHGKKSHRIYDVKAKKKIQTR